MELHEQRARLIASTGLSEEVLRERGEAFQLYPEHQAVWETVHGIDYLLNGAELPESEPRQFNQSLDPAVWVDGHPQLEAIAAAVWEQCDRSDSGICVEDDPRNIAVAALDAIRQTEGGGR